VHFKRHITPFLIEWKKSSNRKPLILRGARQVGKTTLVKQFSKSYKNFILLNLEREKDIRFFEEFSDVTTIIDALFIENNIQPSQIHETLLFIDEIQESPKAIALLRYFYEDSPKLNVIAAGSLLEHSIRKIKNFPVGRIQNLHLYPLNFSEFLGATDNKIVLEQLNSIPVKKVAHRTLLDLFNSYTIIGGMPEVVKRYVESSSISALTTTYESIWSTYKDDVEKYASSKTDARVIKHIMSTAHLYLDERIKFQNFGNSNYKSREVGEAMRNLDDARIIQLIYPTTNTSPPVKSDLKKSPRLQFLDTGLVNNELDIQAELLSFSDLSEAYKGAIIPHIITQELISLNATKYRKPNFWVREKKQSSAEVDLVLQHEGMVIPVEIKSGKVGKLKSLHQFIEKSDHPYAVRMYGGEFSIEEHITQSGKKYFLMNLPYYLGTKIDAYLGWFCKEYSEKNNHGANS